MIRFFVRAATLATAVAFLPAACGEGGLDMTAQADGTVVSAIDTLEVSATAVNVGSERVVWGQGSSSCQFDLMVAVNGVRRRAAAVRVCTADRTEHGLDPGESRTEILPWTGLVFDVDGEVERLPPGSYSVRAVAGSKGSSPEAAIEVAALDH